MSQEQEKIPTRLIDVLPGHIAGLIVTAICTYGMLESTGLPKTLNAAMAVSSAVINLDLYRSVFSKGKKE